MPSNFRPGLTVMKHGDEDCEIVPMELPNPEKNKS